MKTRNQQKSFTLTEILIYVAVLSIITLAASSFFLWISRSNIKARAMREVTANGERVIQMITAEIKEAENIYTPTSVFDSHPGQLSLEATKYLPEGESTTYIDFYLCGSDGTRLCFKKESQDPIALTSEKVEVNNLVFNQIITSGAPSVQINLKIDYKSPANKPEYQASFDTISTVSLRSY